MNSSFTGSTLTMSFINHNPMKDFEVVCPPDDAISCMAFSPSPIPQSNFLIAGGWDNQVRCWKIEETGNSIPQLQHSTVHDSSSAGCCLERCKNNLFPIYMIYFLFYIHSIFRMAAKCLWLVVTAWPKAGI